MSDKKTFDLIMGIILVTAGALLGGFVIGNQGRQIRTSWFDQSKTPYVSSKGYVTMSSSYAEDGTKTDTYYDAAGNVVVMQ